MRTLRDQDARLLVEGALRSLNACLEDDRGHV
jgi:hypothetical protein